MTGQSSVLTFFKNRKLPTLLFFIILALRGQTILQHDNYAFGSTAIGMLGLRSFLKANLGRPTEFLARLTVFFINIAIVIGPTPPGTGVIADATFWQDSKSQSPTMR